MLCDGNDGDMVSGWAIIPENPVRRRSALLCISLKDLLPFWSLGAGKLMCLKAMVSWIGCQQFYGLLYRLILFSQGWLRFQTVEIGFASISPIYLKQEAVLKLIQVYF